MADECLTELYNPQVLEKIKPKVGREFNSEVDAYAFYNAYAKEVGFSIRIDSSKKKKETGELIWKQCCCSKEGYKDERKQIILGHNHPLTTPSKVHLLRSHRQVSEAKKILMTNFSSVNVSTSQQIGIMKVEFGGIQNVGCTERDIINHEKLLRGQLKGYDAETLYEFFMSKQEKNPSFYLEFNKDIENRMTRCFWADPIGIRAYNFFGDAVVFDTTYNTNKYNMIFAPLAEVNHRGQTIIFGCGLLSDEKTNSFVWLFKQWLKAMPSGPPQIIITDQDQAITKAITEVLPSTFHRYCI